MTIHGRSRSTGRAGIQRTSDAAPRVSPPSKGATSSAKTLNVVRVSNVSKVDGDSDGAAFQQPHSSHCCYVAVRKWLGCGIMFLHVQTWRTWSSDVVIHWIIVMIISMCQSLNILRVLVCVVLRALARLYLRDATGMCVFNSTNIVACNMRSICACNVCNCRRRHAGLQTPEGRQGQGGNTSRRKKDSSSVREQSPGPDMSSLL